MSKLPSYYEIENEGVIERLTVELERLRHAHNGEVCVAVQEAYDTMKAKLADALAEKEAREHEVKLYQERVRELLAEVGRMRDTRASRTHHFVTSQPLFSSDEANQLRQRAEEAEEEVRRLRDGK